MAHQELSLTPLLYSEWVPWTHVLDGSNGLKLKPSRFFLNKTIDGMELCGLVWCFYQLLFWTLILMAPIHFRGSLIMIHFSKSVLMKKQTHLHLWWPEGEYFFFWQNIPLKELHLTNLKHSAFFIFLVKCWLNESPWIKQQLLSAKINKKITASQM